MNLDRSYRKIENCSEPFRSEGRSCTHCERRVERLRSEESCPETYRCLFCKSLWILKGRLILDASDLDGISDAEWDAMQNDDTFPGIFILLD
jgi:hypothetical protein